MLPFSMDLDLYNILKDWSIQCSASISIKVKDNTIEVYSKK